MSYVEALRLALRRLRTNPLRTALTTLGVVIGVASLVALIGVGEGTQTAITNQIAGLGTNLLSVNAGGSLVGGVRGAAGSASTLTLDDASAIATLPGVAAVAPEMAVSNAVVVDGRTNTTTSMTGTTPAEASVRNYQIQTGSFLSDLAVARGLRVAVLGPTTVASLNRTPEAIVGQTVTINGIPFTVVGVTQPKGGSGFLNPDDVVFAPISAVQSRFTGAKSLRTIGVSLADPSQLAYVESEIQSLLRYRHQLASSASDDFTMVSQDQLLSVASTTTSTIRNFLIGIAAIALVVGGIGIANTMLVSVRERVREIGTRKAIGARRRDIGRQFLVEAVIVTLGGAVAGVLLGIAVTGVVGSAVNVPASPTLTGIALAFGSALLVGVVAGYWPARQASRLDPVEALRYE
ncbi:MAG TPA: ABC transporter permease [Candidatus Angelobacter sp.]|nr:ABC transporter permease [Candidatus Angelobacter sp.]